MKPLVRRTPDGRRYAMPTAPQHPAPEPAPQSASDTTGGPEPTPPQPGRHMGRAKLTDDEVRAIRADYAAGKWTQGELAYIYGVSVGAVGAVLSGRSYTHVTRGRTWKHAADDTEPTTTEQES